VTSERTVIVLNSLVTTTSSVQRAQIRENCEIHTLFPLDDRNAWYYYRNGASKEAVKLPTRTAENTYLIVELSYISVDKKLLG
jgi:hypothetical protein